MVYARYIKVPLIADGLSEKIQECADADKFYSGKWVIGAPSNSIDKVWEVIANLCYKGKLGPEVKVSGKDETGLYSKHVVCVYLEDYRDEEKLQDVYETINKALTELGDGVEFEIRGFKADINTCLGVESFTQDESGKRIEDGRTYMKGIPIDGGYSEYMYSGDGTKIEAIKDLGIKNT